MWFSYIHILFFSIIPKSSPLIYGSVCGQNSHRVESLNQICGLLDASSRICEQTHRSVFDVTAKVSGWCGRNVWFVSLFYITRQHDCVHCVKLHSDFHLEDNSINCGPIMVACAAEINEEACQRRPAGWKEKQKVRRYIHWWFHPLWCFIHWLF